MDRLGIPFIRGVPDYEVADGNVYISIGGQTFCAFPINVFEQGAHRARVAIAKYRADLGEVIPFRRSG